MTDTSDIDRMIAIRRGLCYRADENEGAFPGSRAYAERSAALKDLAKFDQDHPEVLTEIRRRREKRVGPINIWM